MLIFFADYLINFAGSFQERERVIVLYNSSMAVSRPEHNTLLIKFVLHCAVVIQVMLEICVQLKEQ
jgi:hypothetical protein